MLSLSLTYSRKDQIRPTKALRIKAQRTYQNQSLNKNLNQSVEDNRFAALICAPPLRFTEEMPTLSQQACFSCRKVFKKPHYYGPAEDAPLYPCPDCGEPMKAMGYKFRAPEKKNKKEWQRIEKCEKDGIAWTTRTIRKEEEIESTKLSQEMNYYLGIKTKK